MAGLDSRGVMDGAAAGFGLMDRYLQRQHTQGLQEQQNERAERRFGMEEERFDTNMADADRKRDQEQAQFVLGKVAQGMDITEDEYQFLEKNPQYWPALDSRTDKSIETAQAVIDPDNPMGPNDPEVIDAMNQLWGPRINRGDGGKKRIAGLYPGPRGDTVALELEVEKDDGTKYKAPMTRNRSTADDDPVLETPVESLINQVQGYRLLRNAFRTPEAQAQATKLLTALTGQKAEKSKPLVVNGKLVDPDTGALIADYSEPDKDRYGQPFKHPELGWVQAGPDNQLHQMDPPGSSSKPPSDVQTAEWMVANGIAGSLDEAYTRVQESRSDPSRFVASYVDQELKAQESAGVYPGDPNYLTTEQMREKAIGVLQEIRAQTRGTAPESPETPKGLTLVDSTVETLPADGSAVQQADGSYSGRVNRGPVQAGMVEPGARTNAPAPVQTPAPRAAVEHLRKNPNLADAFKAKYGYLPEGF